MVEEHPGGVDPKQALFHFNERCWTANERGLSLVVVIQQFGFQDPMIITFPLKLAINWSESTIFGQTHVAESHIFWSVSNCLDREKTATDGATIPIV